MIFKAALDSFRRRQFLRGLVGVGGALFTFFRSSGAYARSLTGNMISRGLPWNPFLWGITSTMKISSVIRKETSVHSRPTVGQNSGPYASAMIRPVYSTTTMAREISATASSFWRMPESSIKNDSL